MATHLDEEEQLEALKRWWNENGKSIVAGIVLGFSALIGAKLWFDYQNTRAEAASAEYQQLTAEVEAGQDDSVMRRARHLVDTYPGSPYASLAALMAAKIHVEKDELEAARDQYQWVLDHGTPAEYVIVARIRLAQLMLALGDAQQGLTLLSGIDSKGFEALVEETRGDLFQAQNDVDQARTAYEKALQAADGRTDTELLRLKLDDLGS